ncbi:MAG: tRNA 2-thiouridine(34) synthase MnmA [Thermodesulfovibrionales bacterium]
MEKVLVALSGGVDSSVCAFLLREQGYKVVGASLLLYDDVNSTNIELAIQTSKYLGIQHLIIDARTEFLNQIITPFYEAYTKGLTPNPCVMCNRGIKFQRLLQEANLRDTFYISTGHYARISDGKLLRGTDTHKDQSYVLYRLSHEQILRTKLPLGELHKDVVRSIASKAGLPTSSAKESHEVCFLKGSSYTGHFKGSKKGVIRDVKTGQILGRHNGIEHYTIGQRKRLGISHPTPLYVVSIEHETNTIYVGDFDSAHSDIVRVKDINWIIKREKDFSADVKIRYTMKPAPAFVSIVDNDSIVVRFNKPQWAPAPGQSAVFYEGDVVIGGGIIY